MSKKNCLNCHFLCARITHPIHHEIETIVAKKYRDLVDETNSVYPLKHLMSDCPTTIFCKEGYWDEEKTTSFNSGNLLYDCIVKKNRSNCFYQYDSTGMTAEKAVILRDAKKKKIESICKACLDILLKIKIPLAISICAAFGAFVNQYWHIILSWIEYHFF